jgi:RNA polymerase I-specific transcription initiation factor RRN7
MAHNSRETPHSPRSASSHLPHVYSASRETVVVLDKSNVYSQRTNSEKLLLTRDFFLQGITRDLWALRLRRLQGRVSYDSETDTEGGQSQVFSSQSEGESQASQTTRGSRRRRQAKTDGAISLSETLVICYVGTLLMRVPLTVADLISRIDNGEMLYYKAAKEVPDNLRERLPGEFQVLLEPQKILRASTLHHRILQFGTLLNTEFGMMIPAVNHPLLLYRWMQHLALPIEVYAATQRLAHLLGIDFTLQFGGKTDSNRVLRYPEVQLMSLLIVSTKLFFPIDDIDRHPVSANDLSALKLDWSEWAATQNAVQMGDEPSIHTSKDTTSPDLTFPEAFKISESDCLAMGEDELDRYMDWYQENLTSENIREQGRAGRDADFRRTLMRMFPTQPSRPTLVSSKNGEGESKGKGKSAGEDTSLARDEASNTTQRLRQVQHALRPKKIAVSSAGEGRDEVARAGSFYRRHREAKDLDGPARLLYTKAAELAGMSLESMTRAVFLIERKLQMREERARKAGEDDTG